MPAAHGLFGIFLVGKYVRASHSHTYHKRDGKHRRSDTEVLPRLVFPRLSKFGEEKDTYHHADIIGHLRMQKETNVGEEHHQQCPPSVLLAIGQHKAHHYEGHPRDGIAFPVVGSADDYKEIRG